MKFSISSCWNSHRHEDGYAMLCEMAELGFKYVELSHGIRLTLVPGILQGVEEGVIEVSSLHNFCPLPVGVMGAAPNLYEPSAISRKERVLWHSNTLKTLDFASRVLCDRIVIHSGRAHFLWGDPEPLVEAAFDASGGDPKNAQLVKAGERGMAKLNRKKKGFMRRLDESYKILVENAKERGVCFGVENREAFCELPLDDDLVPFLESLKEHEVFGYWHDTGHAQLKERMGLLDHRKHLEQLRPYLLGFHIHDVSESNRDHQVPGSGVIDWSILSDMVQAEDVVILEMSPRLKPDDIRRGRDFLMETIPAIGQHG
jgi:sugar phosphate isomerase/epimerase